MPLLFGQFAFAAEVGSGRFCFVVPKYSKAATQTIRLLTHSLFDAQVWELPLGTELDLLTVMLVK